MFLKATLPALMTFLIIGLMLALIALTSGAPIGHAAHRKLTFESRVAAQRLIEQIYWKHRIWPADNPRSKPAFGDSVPESAIRAKVADYLQQDRAIEFYRGRPLASTELQSELVRMATHTQDPEMLRELWSALGNDAFVVAECLVRPLLVNRLMHDLDHRVASSSKKHTTPGLSSPSSSLAPTSVSLGYWLPEIVREIVPCASSDAWSATPTAAAPSGRNRHTAVWTGSEMIVWGGFADDIGAGTGGRYNPATDSWTSTTIVGAPGSRIFHTAVWTGSEMIVWGGEGDVSAITTNTGGRYNPTTDSWTSTTTVGAPSARGVHTAVWTGSEMIVWGGGRQDTGNSPTNTGGRYNPTTNSWTSTTTVGAPSSRSFHAAVWTGSEMIVWGASGITGGRYNPTTDSWTSTTIVGAPSSRILHTAVWTGSEMIVWGGLGNGVVNTGGRYNPTTDSWTSTTIVGAPSARADHTAVWTGSEMIVWGGVVNTGGRYNPTTDSWTSTTTAGAPPGERPNQTAVWTGSEMIVWGAGDSSGGRYFFIPLLAFVPTTQTFSGSGGGGSIVVNAQDGCTWTATSNSSFITITSGSTGSGNGIVTFTVAANPLTSQRSGTILISGRAFSVLQSATQPNPVPVVTSLSPTSAISGSGTLILTVAGSNFVPASVVRWNGSDRSTTFFSSTQIVAQLLASDLANPGAGSVIVFNPLPGGGTSNTVTFPILSNVVTVSAASYAAPVAQESIAAAFGVDLASTVQAAQTVPLPTILADVRLQIRDGSGIERDAPLFFVSPTQINYLVPPGTSAGLATTRVFRGNTRVGEGLVQITSVAPGVFTANADGEGAPAAYLIRVKPNGQQIEESAIVINQQTGRFIPREIDLTIAGDRVFLILFGTGIRFHNSINSVVMRFGNEDQQVDAALPQGFFVGLDQVNVEMLRIKIPPGPLTATLRVGGIPAKSVSLLVK